MAGDGFLAIWTDIEDADSADYRSWLTREHIRQRIEIPGFLGSRVHVAIDSRRSHFILYAASSPAIFQERDYLDVLNNPTEATRCIMPKLKNFDRAAGKQIFRAGDGCGSHLIVSRIAAKAENPSCERMEKVFEKYKRLPGFAGARLLRVDRPATDLDSREKTMRKGGEGSFQFVAVIETIDLATAFNVQPDMAGLAGELLGDSRIADSQVYTFLYALFPFELGEQGPWLTNPRSIQTA